jgi:hypothetical protein
MVRGTQGFGEVFHLLFIVVVELCVDALQAIWRIFQFLWNVSHWLINLKMLIGGFEINDLI